MKTLVGAVASDLQPGDLVRGLTHSRIVTGPPVRVVRTRVIGAPGGVCHIIRVSYFIVGKNEYGWRDVSPDRTVTVERDLPPFTEAY